MMPPLRSFDDVDGRERGQKKTDDLRAMTTLGPRTLFKSIYCDDKLIFWFNFFCHRIFNVLLMSLKKIIG